jgi:ornithine cyclodeaminase/alanine dehydrogenase-like protein (mu-crystallin family)
MPPWWSGGTLGINAERAAANLDRKSVMPALYLTEADVCHLADLRTALDAVRGAFVALGEGTAENVPRRRASTPTAMLHNMHAAAEYLGVVGAKIYATTKQGMQFHVLLYDATTGALIAMIEADHLGRLRTGAASGVATELMARPDAHSVGLFGTGRQAKTQLEAVCAVRRITKVEVFSRNADRCALFAEEMSNSLRTEVVPAMRPDMAVMEKDIVITATSAKTPLFDGRLIGEGTHLNVVGSNFLRKAEIDVETVRRADIVVCDSIEACRLEAGDFVAACEAGVKCYENMHDLAAVVTGQATGRAMPQDVTLFKSVGLAIEDVALGHEIVRRAREAGVGREFP